MSTPSLGEIVRDQSHDCLNAKLSSNIILNKNDILISIKYINIYAFKKLIQYGSIPNYNTMNILLVSLSDSYIQAYIPNDYHNIHSTTIRKMIEYTMDIGYELDPFQYQMLQNIDNNWLKSCIDRFHKSLIRHRFSSDHIKNALFIHDTTYDDDIPMEQLKKGLIRSLVLRKNMKIQSYYHHALQYSREEVILNGEIDDLDISYYIENIRDNDGDSNGDMNDIDSGGDSNGDKNKVIVDDNEDSKSEDEGDLYLFSPDLFTNLCDSGENFLTQQKLPYSYIDNMANQRSFLKRLGYDTSYTSSSKHKNHVDNSKMSQILRTHFLYLSSLYGVSSELLITLNTNQLKQILESININPWYLEFLQSDHQLSTFYTLSYKYLQNNPGKVEMFFSCIENMMNP